MPIFLVSYRLANRQFVPAACTNFSGSTGVQRVARHAFLIARPPSGARGLKSSGKLGGQFPKLLVAGEVPLSGGGQILNGAILVVV